MNFLFSQIFVNYNLQKGWYLSSAPIITANWEADSGDQWTVPVGGGAGKLQHVGKLLIVNDQELAQLQWRCAVIQTDDENLHSHNYWTK